ncbi:adenylyltransferase/sulfurtransferase [Melghirimyces profundicolus]|uniref:Adenylyltransferase/sulfurtransferase n=1 Tax=Melghirimyces profundicolus TaxID=1242148 RepID=A0A2T6BRZ5_9BACL|nr:ThiF family adenylyltransferase [Melghirimyces profundicolus]PTX58863.1 adenylyltransferase/sulfurtransferase [Melghirimyces profundicolus]
METDRTRYSRQILFKPIGETGQKRLSRARVAVVGLGALGTALSHHMVRAGVGYIRLIDRDFVEPSNLQRQMLFDEADAEQGLPKAVAAQNKLAAINSRTQFQVHVTDLAADRAEELLTGVDLILDGTDNFAVRYLINDVSVKHGIPWIYGGAVSSRGMTFTIRPKLTPCLRCLFPEAPGPGTAETCDTAGVIGPVVQVVAAHQATEALKLLVGDVESLEPRLRHFELWDNRDTAFRVENRKRRDCPTCGEARFDFLEEVNAGEAAVSLCGRDTVQISPARRQSLDLNRLEKALSPLGRVERNRFLLRAQVDEQHRLVLFPDGRVLVQGTSDPSMARSLVARYIGG